MYSNDEKKDLLKGLKDSSYTGGIVFDEPLAGYTTLRIGGPAKMFLQPVRSPDVCAAIRFLNSMEITWSVLGGGSNTLFPDYGYMGALIKFSPGMDGFEERDDHLRAEAGLKLHRLMNLAVTEGYGGMDFLTGIPGTIGGALALNAGTRDEWIDSRVLWVEALTRDGDFVRCLKPKGGYREGILGDRGYTFTAVALKREDTDPGEVRARMIERMSKRLEAQPGGVHSAGSVFRNPEGKSAWQLIDSVGLREHRIGGAAFSEKHCNFIVCGNGTNSEDVLQLISLAEEKVFEKHGLKLEREITLTGFDLEEEVSPAEDIENAIASEIDEGECATAFDENEGDKETSTDAESEVDDR